MATIDELKYQIENAIERKTEAEQEIEAARQELEDLRRTAEAGLAEADQAY